MTICHLRMGLEQIVPNLTKTHSDPFLLDYSRLFIGPFFMESLASQLLLWIKRQQFQGRLNCGYRPSIRLGKKKAYAINAKL